MRVWLGVVVLSMGCARLPDGVLFRCSSNAECAANERCLPIDGVSYCLPLDGGSDGGASTDAGSTDAGPDAGAQRDGGELDAGSDAGAGDAGTDGGTDAGTTGDAGAFDGGTISEICNETSCNGQPCGASVGGCLCGCSPGLTCDVSQACSLPRVCAGAWCYEHPLPQGGHLTAAWASQVRPLKLGVISAVWGGERGVLLEWDGLHTTPTQLPSSEGDVVGFFETDAGLHAVTDLASVFRRDATAWSRAPHLAPDTVILPNGAARFRPCPAFGRTKEGNFLGCTTTGGNFTILRVDARQFVIEAVFGIPDAGAARPVTVSDVGDQVLFSVGVRGQPTLVRRAGGTWTGYPGPSSVSPIAAFATTQTTLYAAYEFGGYATNSRVLNDAGFYEFSGFNGTFSASATVPFGGFTAVLGDGIATLGPGGFLLEDGGLLIARDPASLHSRRWLAGASMPEGLLAVGAFGATAFFRQSGVATLASSTFAVRPTDLCRAPGGNRLFATTSATWLEPLFDRSGDSVRLRETDRFKGVMERTATGSWVPVADGRGVDAGWANSLDQCWVDRQGTLHTASPIGFSSFLLDGGVTGLSTVAASWLDAGLPYVPGFLGFVAESGSFLAAGSNVLLAAEGSSLSRSVAFGSPPAMWCAFASIGAERLCAPDPNQLRAYRSLAGEGARLDAQALPNGLNSRASVTTSPTPDGGEQYVFLAHSPSSAVVLTRPPCAQQAVSGCEGFSSVATRSLGAREGVSNLASEAGGRLLWLRTKAALEYDGVSYFCDRDLTVALDWLDPDGGISSLPAPSFVYDQRCDFFPFELSSTAGRVLLKTSRGVISRPSP